jgi:hypothetical protein
LIKKLDKTEVSAQEYKGRVEIMDTPEFRKAIQDAKLSADEITLIQWTEVPDWIKNETLDVLYVQKA